MSVLGETGAVGGVAGEIVAAGTVGAVGALVFRTLWRQSGEWQRIASDRQAEIVALRAEMQRRDAAQQAEIAALRTELWHCRDELHSLMLQIRGDNGRPDPHHSS